MSRVIRPLETAVCNVVGISHDDLWSRRKTQHVRMARGLFAYVLTKVTPLTVEDVADMAGRDPRHIDEARAVVARRAFHCPATRRALHDIAAACGHDPRALIPRPVEQVPA